MIHEDFVTFIEAVILPMRRLNPNHARLDGNSSGGNREIKGMFRHHGKVWKVHADTHYEPLILAYNFIKDNKNEDPFLQNATGTGIGNCLVLKSIIQQSSSKPRFKYLYIYEVSSALHT